MSHAIAVLSPMPVALALVVLLLVLLALSALALSFRTPGPVRAGEAPGREETWPR